MKGGARLLHSTVVDSCLQLKELFIMNLSIMNLQDELQEFEQNHVQHHINRYEPSWKKELPSIQHWCLYLGFCDILIKGALFICISS